MVDNNVLPIVGLVVCENNETEMTPKYALDLMYDKSKNNFNYMFSDKDMNESYIVEEFDTVNKNDIFSDIVKMITKEPISSYIS